MSILIKDMEMPKSCVVCPMIDGENGLCQYNGKDSYVETRREDCPLVEILTPHGRLIDVDGLEHLRWSYKDAYYYIDNAPTVIESEE